MTESTASVRGALAEKVQNKVDGRSKPLPYNSYIYLLPKKDGISRLFCRYIYLSVNSI